MTDVDVPGRLRVLYDEGHAAVVWFPQARQVIFTWHPRRTSELHYGDACAQVAGTGCTQQVQSWGCDDGSTGLLLQQPITPPRKVRAR